MFIAAKSWKQFKCSIAGKQLNKTAVHLYHGILLSNKKEQYTNTCNNLDDKGIMLSEKKSQSLSISYFLIPFI